MIEFFYIMIFIGLIAYGISVYISQSKRDVQLKRMLNPYDLEEEKTPKSQQEVTSIEKVFRKSSNLLRLSAHFDSNLQAKLIVAFLLALIPYFIDQSGIYSISNNMMIIIAIFILIIVIVLPSRIKQSMINARIKRIANDIPFIIDMMAVCVQSSMTVEATLLYLANNTSQINNDIALLFARTMAKAEVSGISSGLELLYLEVPCQEMRMLSSALQQSIQRGSTLYDILLDLSKEIREMQLLETEERISSLSAKMSIPMIVFVMLPTLVMVAGPSILGVVKALAS